MQNISMSVTITKMVLGEALRRKHTRRNGSLPRPGPTTRQSNLSNHLSTSARTLLAMELLCSSLKLVSH